MRFTFFSTCPESWGGSEELWSAAACALSGMGHRVQVYKTGVESGHPKIERLLRSGCLVQDLDRQLYPRAIRLLNKWLLPTPMAYLPHETAAQYNVIQHLRRFRPHLAVVSQGENFDGVHWAESCRLRDTPYVLVCQKASDAMWPNDFTRDIGLRAFAGALTTCFVSERNRKLTESQLGQGLPRSRVVRNPVLAGRDGPLPWPAGPLRLACVARLWVLDKGQDLLLDVLAQPQWRERPLSVSLVGAGAHERGLKGRAAQLGLGNVEFLGQVGDIEAVWREHHALILPSRAEGLPLAAVEAMMCGRPCIMTAVGGNAELLSTPDVGYLAEAPSVDALSRVLERAWEERSGLEAMGQAAARHVREFVTGKPEEDFVELLLTLAKP